MLTNALLGALQTVFESFAMVALLRFYAQVLRAPMRARSGNPIADLVMALTDWAVKPLRRVLPAIGGFDTASFVLAWVTIMVLHLIVTLVINADLVVQTYFWPTIALQSLVHLLRLSIYLLMAVVFFDAILSWISPYHPIRPFFDALSKPFLRPMRRLIPLVGGIDLSPLVLLLILQVLLAVPLYLESQIGRWPG